MSIKNTSLAGKLRRLGSTPNDIAANLAKAHIKGIPEHRKSCAIAEFLVKSVKGAKGAEVTGSECRVYGEELDVQCNMPRAVQGFIRMFDHGGFRGLDASKDDGYEFGPRRPRA